MPEVISIEYRDISGFPGYRVGDDGSVWSCLVPCKHGRNFAKEWRKMTLQVSHRGYLQVNTTDPNGRIVRHRVHRLVLKAFVGNCPAGMECRHLNGIKTDCRLVNLAWGTQKQNCQDNHDNGAYRRGETNTQAKLTDDDVISIRNRYDSGGIRQLDLAAQYGIDQSMISFIVNRKSWKHLP